MSIRKFIIQVCGVFLSISLSKTLEKTITGFSLFTLIAGLLTFFLALNFFFAKFKQLNEDDGVISAFGFVINITTLMCFAAMPYFIDYLPGIMGTQICLRISDVLLILYNNKFDPKEIDALERRWLAFDIIYFFVIIAFMVLSLVYASYILDIILLTAYFLMGVFESVFDFYVNRTLYGIVDAKEEKTAEEEVAKQ